MAAITPGASAATCIREHQKLPVLCHGIRQRCKQRVAAITPGASAATCIRTRALRVPMVHYGVLQRSRVDSGVCSTLGDVQVPSQQRNMSSERDDAILPTIWLAIPNT